MRIVEGAIAVAGTAPEPTVEKVFASAAQSRTLALPRFGGARWVPPLLLALLTALAVVLAYGVRPALTIDLGDYYDTPFLPFAGTRDATDTDFFAREIGATGAAPIEYSWPSDQTTLELPGGRAGIWQLTVEAAAAQPDGALDQIALTANDVRVSIARRGPRDFVAVIPADVIGAERLTLRLNAALVGDPAPPAGLAGRVLLTPARTYRWSSDRSTISMPGLGRGDWVVTLDASVHHPDNSPLDATVYANGAPIGRLPDGGPRRLALFVPGALVPDGDLTLTITANTFRDPRPLGVLIYELRVAPAGPHPWLPPLDSLAYALVVALCLYVCLLRTLPVSLGARNGAALAAVLALGVVLLGAWALAVARYPAVFMLPRLAGLALWSVALLLILERLLDWAFRRAGVPLSGWALRGLLLIFFVGYWIKAGGMLYPYFIGIDVAWHMGKVRQILAGQLPLFYGTNSPLNESTMPTAEWGANRPVIPYSPWFHIFATLFTLVPLPLVLTANMFSAMVDGSRVFLIGLLGRKIGLDERESLMAGLLYAVTPATFLLHSWGNIPTTFGMWWTLLSTVYVLVAYRQLGRRWPFAILVALLTITLLIYTVMAAFLLVFLGLLVPALWLAEGREPRTENREPTGMRRGEEARRRGGEIIDLPAALRLLADHNSRRSVLALALATLLALGIATLVYYGQYIGPILERTVPYFLQAATPDTSVGLQNRDPFLTYLANYWPRMEYLRASGAYGLQLALPLGLLGMFCIRDRRARVALACWLAVALLFLVVGSRISMVDKHVFFAIPALALGVGLLAGRLWRRGMPGRFVVFSVYLFTFVAALNIWIYRIAAVRQ
jgi:hypothetical protein